MKTQVWHGLLLATALFLVGSTAFAAQSAIVVRVDDVQDWYGRNATLHLVNRFEQDQLSLSLGVIPTHLGQNQAMVSFLQQHYASGDNARLEITMHGLYHTPNEFVGLGYEENIRRIEDGSRRIEGFFSQKPTVFTAPYNVYDADTVQALKDQNFVLLSAGTEFRRDGQLKIIGSNARLFTGYENGQQIAVTPEETIMQCQQAIEQYGVCVLLVHPQDFLDPNNQVDLDPQRVQDFEWVLQQLKSMNAPFLTFEQYYQSTNRHVLGNTLNAIQRLPPLRNH